MYILEQKNNQFQGKVENQNKGAQFADNIKNLYD